MDLLSLAVDPFLIRNWSVGAGSFVEDQYGAFYFWRSSSSYCQKYQISSFIRFNWWFSLKELTAYFLSFLNSSTWFLDFICKPIGDWDQAGSLLVIFLLAGVQARWSDSDTSDCFSLTWREDLNSGDCTILGSVCCYYCPSPALIFYFFASNIYLKALFSPVIDFSILWLLHAPSFSSLVLILSALLAGSKVLKLRLFMSCSLAHF